MQQILKHSLRLVVLLSSVILLSGCGTMRSVPVEVKTVDTDIKTFHPPVPRGVTPLSGLDPLTCVMDDQLTVVYGLNESDDIRLAGYISDIERYITQLRGVVDYYRSIDNSSLIKKEPEE